MIATGGTRPTGRAPRRSGLVLLEVMVALVILGVAAAGYLALLQGSHRLVTRSREWSAAVRYAADGMERAKRSPPEWARRADTLPGGFPREVARQPWRTGLTLITVTVALPTGGHFVLRRVMATGQDSSAEPAPAPRERGGSDADAP